MVLIIWANLIFTLGYLQKLARHFNGAAFGADSHYSIRIFNYRTGIGAGRISSLAQVKSSQHRKHLRGLTEKELAEIWSVAEQTMARLGYVAD